MFDFHEKRKIRSLLYSKVVIFILFLFAGFMLFSAYNRYTVSNDMKAKLEARSAELEELQARSELLESKVKYLENERGIEEELRSRFDVAKEGEQVIILLDQKNEKKMPGEEQSATGESELMNTEAKHSFWSFLKFW